MRTTPIQALADPAGTGAPRPFAVAGLAVLGPADAPISMAAACILDSQRVVKDVYEPAIQGNTHVPWHRAATSPAAAVATSSPRFSTGAKS